MTEVNEKEALQKQSEIVIANMAEEGENQTDKSALNVYILEQEVDIE